MKNILIVFGFIVSFASYSQTQEYQIASYLDKGIKAPNTNYLGEAWLNSIIRSSDSLPYNLTKATFKANATLNWHKHTDQQVLIVVDGIGYYQERGKQPILIKEGDVIQCASNTEHWHSSSKDRDVTYLALYKGVTQWTTILTQDAYDEVAELLSDNGN